METTYNELIGYNTDGNAVILLYTFDYGDGFKGATGAILELVSEAQFDEATTPEALEEHAEALWRENVGEGGTTLGLSDWAEMERDELIENLYDDSYAHIVPDGEHVATNCVAGGRIFPGALDDIVTWVRPDLADLIRQAEGEN